jgi:DNA-binding HxlR family transcriptional regulator
VARTRPYDQYCALAAALEVIGDRWTPLIVRDLAIGNRRFSELATSLTGIPQDVLTARLRLLQEHGLVERAGPDRSAGYGLTAHGRELMPALGAVASWGARHLGPQPHDDQLRSRYALTAFALGFDPTAADGVDAVVELAVDDEAALLRVGGGTFLPAPAGTHADVSVRTDVVTAYALGRRRISVTDARRSKRLRVHGDATLVPIVFRMFRFPSPQR